MPYIKGCEDEKFFNYRLRREKHKKWKFRIYYGGRNLGKTSNVFRTEMQDIIAEFNRHKDPTRIKPILSIIRTEKTWQRIKNNYLDNLKQDPFNLDFVVEKDKVWYVKTYEKTDKDGDTKIKHKKMCVLIQIIYLWSANSYKLANLEHYKCMIFDEVIPEGEDYIPNEIGKFNNLLSTFSRLEGDKYVIGICNNITDSSPYFSMYGMGSDKLPKIGECFINPQKKVLIEYVKSSDELKEALGNSLAGQIQNGDDEYAIFTRGEGFLKSENFQILTKPSGTYSINYNVWLDGESFCLYQYSKTAYWIKNGREKFVRDYYLDKKSALINNDPYRYSSPDSLVNDYKIKLQKERLWFKETETRDKFINFLKKY